jgi:hypothetical protein
MSRASANISRFDAFDDIIEALYDLLYRCIVLVFGHE